MPLQAIFLLSNNMKKIFKLLSNNLAYTIVGVLLTIVGGVALAANVTVPPATTKGDIPVGINSLGNYQLQHPCSDGQILAASSTAVSGWACVTNSASSGIASSSVATLISPLIANGTVAGVNATSSSVNFLIQGTGSNTALQVTGTSTLATTTVPTIVNSDNSTNVVNSAYIHNTAPECSIAWFGAKGDGTTDDSNAFKTAQGSCSSISLVQGKTYFFGSTTTLLSSLQLTSTATTSTAQIIVGTGVTLTLDGSISAPLQKIFSLQGTGKVVMGYNVNAVYPEWWGAVGDGSTDDTVPIQAAINAISLSTASSPPSPLSARYVNLSSKTYITTSALSITNSGVGITGNGRRLSIIESTSASADIIDVNGLSQTLSDNFFSDFGIRRSMNPTGNSNGLSVINTFGTVENHTESADSVRDYYYNGVNSGGTGLIENNQAGWNNSESSGNYYGYYIDSGNSKPNNSLRFSRNTTGNAIGAGIHVYGKYFTGNDEHDFMGYGDETAGVDYGTYINQTGSNSSIASGDLHFIQDIDDTVKVSAIYVTGLQKSSAAIDFQGGWVNMANNNAKSVDIENSYNVKVQGLQFSNAGTNYTGLTAFYINGGSNNSITGNSFTEYGNIVTFNNTSGNTFSDNTGLIPTGSISQTYISLASSTYDTINGNSLGGNDSVGISLDASSSNNTLIGNAIDPLIATATVDNGTNNNWGNIFTRGITQTGGVNTFASTTITQLTLGDAISNGCLQSTGGIISSTGSGCGGGGGTLSGGTRGYVATWASSTSLTIGTLIDNGTVAGVNATSSTVAFNIQGAAGSTNTLFNIASSTGTSLFSVAITTTTADLLDVGTSTATSTATVYVQGTSTQPTLNLFQLASSSGTSYLTVAANGSTTLSSLGLGCVNSTAGGALYVATCAAGGGSGSISTSTTAQIGKVAIWTGLATLGNGSLFDNGTVAGVNATSSTIAFNIQGTAGSTNTLFNIASSTGQSLFSVAISSSTQDLLDIGTSTVASNIATLFVQGTSTNPTLSLVNFASSTGNTYLKIDSKGHLISGGPVPSVSSCGSGSPAVNGTDDQGTITLGGTAPTTCTLTFSQPRTNNYSCNVGDNSLTIASDVSSTSTTAVVFGLGVGGLSGGNLFYHCEEFTNGQ